MRRAARVDANQSSIIKGLRQFGATVQPLHSVGDGCPDLLVGFNGRNTLMEIKDGKLKPSSKRLTSDQVEWHDNWRGQVAKVETLAEAIEALL